MLSAPNVLDDAIQLTNCLVRDIPKLRSLQKIVVQPRHYQRIVDCLVSPDPVFEIVHWNTLVQVSNQFYNANLQLLLHDDFNNAYRSLLGVQGDGVIDMISYT